MSLSNCSECWCSPCQCGHEWNLYQHWTVEEREQLILVLEVMNLGAKK